MGIDVVVEGLAAKVVLIVSSYIVSVKEHALPPTDRAAVWCYCRDVPILASGKYSADIDAEGRATIRSGRITHYVEHPVPIEPPAEAPPPPPQPLKLTKREQKKLRTQRRLAREKERQDMIRQGLLEPPKAKVKMSNLMRVLANETVQDPTRMEQQVRAAAQEREQAHADRNLANKLTPSEKKEKKERKLFDEEGIGGGSVATVFRLRHLRHAQTRFKVDVNAQQNRLTGRCVMSDELALVFVEGGAKPSKRFARLMTGRIDWAAAAAPPEGGGEEVPNSCQLVWQGTVAKPMFDEFKIEAFRTNAAARMHCEEHKCAHYWDLAVNFPTD